MQFKTEMMMALAQPDGDEDDVPFDEPDWRTSLAKARASLREALGDTSIDVVEIIREMRDERDIQILSTIDGEERAIEMVRGTSGSSEDEASPSRHS